MTARKPLFGLLYLLCIIAFSGVATAQEEPHDPIVILEEGHEKVNLYLQISNLFKTPVNDSAIFFAETAKRVAMEEGNAKDIAESLFILGKINLRRDSTQAARSNLYLALNYTDHCDCDSLKAAIYMFLGKLHTYHDNYQEAIVNFLKSQEIAEENENDLILEDLYDDIGLVLAYLQDYDDAMRYFERALELNKVTADKQNHATTLRNIGTIYHDKKQFPEAKQHYLEAYDIYATLNYFPGMSTSYIGIGNAEFGMGNYNAALEYYQKALPIAEQIDSSPKVYGPYVVAMCYNRLGETYIKLGKHSEAIEALRISDELSKEYGMPARRAKASYFFSNVYERMGEIMLSFEYYKTYNQLSDSIINARNVSVITKLQMEYQYLKQQKERELQQLKKEEAHKRKVLIYELMIGISAVMLIMLAVIMILYRKNQRNKEHRAELNRKNLELEKENLQKELEYKNKELTTSVMYQLKKNNFIWNISEKLKGIVIHLRPEIKKSVGDIIKEMDLNMTKESWEEFEFRFNEVHSDFYDNLTKEYPNLTPNELKLSAFLKLNMTTKDIATITYQTSHSITVARHRLRNKLNLERDENLVTFLSKF